MKKKIVSMLLVAAMAFSMVACGTSTTSTDVSSTSSEVSDEQAYIEETLNLANNDEVEWTYDSDADAWVMSIVSAVAYPEIEDEQGVSVCIPGAYITGIDTDDDGEADITADTYTEAVHGNLVIDYDAEITSSNGQTYTAATAPVIINTGAAGYSSSTNTLAATTYASEGYINMSCGNRGKQDTVTDEDGNTTYTGDAPSCLVDQKNATRFVKYNILLGNLPGSVDYFVSTGGSGGGAHAAMFAATSNNSDFYDYEIECGAVGVYQLEDGSYSTTVTIDGVDYDISDGAWGAVAYSAITSLYEADMAMAFEYYLDTDYDFGTEFKEQLAEYLSEEYMEYINDQNLSVEESAVGFDLNDDGDTDDTIALTIEYDEEAYADTNGYGGTYLTLYLAEFQQNLQWYIDNLDYADGWTWFDEDGNALSDEEVAAMTTEDKATAFIEGRYAKATSTGGMDGAPGDMAGGMTLDEDTIASMLSELSDDEISELLSSLDDETAATVEAAIESGDLETAYNALSEDDLNTIVSSLMGQTGDMSGAPDGMDGAPSDMTAGPDASTEEASDDSSERSFANEDVAANSAGDTMDVGTPDAGTTQAAGSTVDSSNYSTYEEMLEAYESDIAEIEAGDEYGNNIVDLYNPLNYIGDEDTENPTWVRIVMGASEGDMSMFSSLNLQIAFLNSGVDATIEWQWDGGHVPSEIFGESLALYVDEMYAEYVDGANTVTKAEATTQTTNGDATEATGTDISSWVDYDDISNVSFTLADAASYRTAGASKTTPGFDVIDYGQEDYVFGDEDQDARHWDSILLSILEEHADVLSELFNSGN